ncbi:MAG: hypothetical protein CL840_05680 [Crocinitomicaceae bacterium]|nr:hypothetical protein [Crocinitomicaceae bacterium]|tara:strand:+ start:2721 stop:3206 length:486 start_codon:yes stop_codon:yes gene_type:complete
MIQMKNLILPLISTIFLFSCQPEGRVFVEHEKLSPNLEWLKKDKREFVVPVEDDTSTYKLSLSFRYANGYQFQVARVRVTEIDPNGEQVVTNHELIVREDNGEYIGEPGYDIWDSEHVIETNKQYKLKGNYKYILEHNMPTDPLHFAMEIGVILDKVSATN